MSEQTRGGPILEYTVGNVALPVIDLIGPSRSMRDLTGFVAAITDTRGRNTAQMAIIDLLTRGDVVEVTSEDQGPNLTVNPQRNAALYLARIEEIPLAHGGTVNREVLSELVESQLAIDAAIHALRQRQSALYQH